VYRWTAARADEPADVPGEDLAGAVAVAPQLEPSFAIRESELPDDTPALVAESLTEDDRVAIEEVEQEAIEDELREVKALVAEEELDEPPSDRVEERPEPLAEELPEVPRPSWEQSSLFDEADEPVDAYGTPLTLVDEIVDRARDEEVATAVEEAEEDHELEEEEEEEEESDEDEEEYDEYDEYDDDADAEDSEEYEDDEEVDEEEEVYAEDEADDEAAVEEEIPGEEENSPEPAVASQAPLKDVVLTPVAPSVPADRQKLLVDAGCLFLDRGRVAVSMLQRQYSMDFDDACKVLDELQEMGLIGPYLGGQRRDILLTRDQWLERVASS
jgi:DNA segregation ATPase FtsK/SpoIIIE-like protein